MAIGSKIPANSKPGPLEETQVELSLSAATCRCFQSAGTCPRTPNSKRLAPRLRRWSLNLQSRARSNTTRTSMPDSLDSSSFRSPDQQRPAVPLPIQREPRPHDPYAAFRFGDFSLFTAGNLLSITGRLMLAVAVEWEIYARTHSATALGLVGLVIAVPVVTLSLPAGHLADRFSRKHIILVSQVFSGFMSVALALVSWKHLSIPAIAPLRAGNHALAAIAMIFERHHPMFHFDDASVPLIYMLLFIGASARTFSWAARSSFFPTLVP